MRDQTVQFTLSNMGNIAIVLFLMVLIAPLSIVFSSWPMECLGFWCVALMRYLPRNLTNFVTQNSAYVGLDHVVHANIFFVLLRTEKSFRLLWRFMVSEPQFHRLLLHSLNTQWIDEKAGFKRY